MPLKMTMEPQEWLMIGDTRVVNIHPLQAKFSIEGAAPVLRQAHTMADADANTPAKRVYLSVQSLYLGVTVDPKPYFSAVEALIRADPSAMDVVEKANRKIASGSFYGALREYRKLVEQPV
ncbi:flagellar biosynthesis repressor FlbT [Tardiphaga sp. 866_E4_N2_1]|uniref:flagellar biosynthesis repressor FlbT n=1 Tax=unclassified Tardiphaga TaxID=2631404 RepID=UPI003F26DB04